MTKKPHIAMILPDRIEHPVGGMGVQAKYLIKHLADEYSFSVHGFPDETTLPYYHNVFNPFPKIQHGGLNTLTGQAAYLASILEMIEEDPSNRPDLIHVMDYTEYLAGTLAAKVLNIPLIASMQLSAHLMHEANLWNAREPQSPDGIAIENSMKEMELGGLQAADHIIHVSNVYKKFFSQLPALDEKSTFIPNGVDLEEFASFKKIDLPGTAWLKVVYLGRLASQKNIASLLQAHVPFDVDLIYVGEKSNDASMMETLSGKTRDNRNIHYLGPAYGQEKINILRSADAVIIPSLHECHPIVMHEAMASGCIVMHSGAGDMIEVLTDDFAINCGVTPPSISIAFQTLANMSAQEVSRRKNKGEEIVKGFTWKKAADQTAEVYRKALGAEKHNDIKSPQARKGFLSNMFSSKWRT